MNLDRRGNFRFRGVSVWFVAFVLTYLLVSFTGMLPEDVRKPANSVGEIFAVLSLPFAFLGFNRANTYAKTAALFYTAFAIFEVSSTMMYPLQGFPQIKAALIGLFLDTKLLIFIFTIVFFADTQEFPTKLFFKRFLQILILLAWLNLAFMARDMIDGKENIYGEHLLIRSGIPLPTGLYIHKAILAQMAAFAVFACLVIGRLEADPAKKRIYLLSIPICLFQALFSFSVKEILSLVLVLTFYLSTSGAKIDYRRALLVVMSFSVISGIVLTTDNPVSRVVDERFGRYTGDQADDRIRVLLVDTSLKIARSHFPFGTGPGTYASAPSRDLGYSPVYVQYKFNRYTGARPNGESNFLLDGFWPKILAEGGWAGFLAYLTYLAFLIRAIFVARVRAPNSGTLRFIELCWLYTLPITLALGVLTHERFVLVLAFTGFALVNRPIFAPPVSRGA